MSAKPPRLDGDRIAAELARLSRAPFQRVLCEFLEAGPDMGAIKAAANKSPDRWAQALAILGRLSGFHEKLGLDTNINVRVSEMSDMDLLAELKRVRQETDLEPLALETQPKN